MQGDRSTHVPTVVNGLVGAGMFLGYSRVWSLGMGGVLWGASESQGCRKSHQAVHKAAKERCGLIKLCSNDTINFGHF